MRIPSFRALSGALVTLALAAAPAVAQDASDFDSLAGGAESTPAPAAVDLGTLKWSGDQTLTWRWGAYPDATRTGGSVDSKVAGEYKWGDLKVVAGGQVRDNEFVPAETALFYAPGKFRFGLGLQEFSWGVADKKNPTDTLNARDYRHGADAPRLVNPAATAAWYPTDWLSLEAVYEPWKEESKFPTDFLATTQAGLSAEKAKLLEGLEAKKAAYLAVGGHTSSDSAYLQLAGAESLLSSTYSPQARVESTDRDFANPVYGGRANFFLPGLDLSLSYLYDRDAFYTPVVTMASYVSGAFLLPSTISLEYKRIHRFGLDAKTTIDKYGLWVEAAYNKTEASSTDSYDNRHDSVDWTTGFDFNFGPGSVYYVNLQYAGTYVLGYDPTTAHDYVTAPTSAQLADLAYMSRATYRSMTQALGDQSEQLMNSLTANLKFPLGDDLVTPSLSGAVIVPWRYDDTVATRLASAYLNPQVDFKPADGVHLLFGADLCYGWIKKAGSSDVTLDTSVDRLGLYSPQNNVYVKVQYQWNGSLGAP